MTFFSEDGLLHNEPMPSRSENALLFLIEYRILVGVDQYTWLQTRNLCANYLDGHTDQDLSWDNYEATAAFASWIDSDFLRNKIKIFSLKRMHPRTIAYLLWVKYPLIGFWFLPIVTIASIFACLRTWKVRPHGRFLATDTKLLTWVRFTGSQMWITEKICTYILGRKKEFGSFERCFEIYFPNEDHPIRQALKSNKHHTL